MLAAYYGGLIADKIALKNHWFREIIIIVRDIDFRKMLQTSVKTFLKKMKESSPERP